MTKRQILSLLLAGCLLAVCLSASGAQASANLHSRAQDVPLYLNPSYDAKLWELVKGFGTIDDTTKPFVAPDFFPAEWLPVEAAAGTAADIPVFGTLALGAAAFGTGLTAGWLIHRGIDDVWTNISGDVGTVTTTADLTGASWGHYTGGTCTDHGAPSAGCYIFATSDGGSCSFSGGYWFGSYLHGSGFASSNTVGDNCINVVDRNAVSVVLASSLPVHTYHLSTGAGIPGGGYGYLDPSVDRTAYWVSDDEMRAAVVTSPLTPYIGQPHTKTTTLSPSPTSAPDPTALAAARAKIGTSDPSVAAEVNCTLDPLQAKCPTGPGDAGSAAEPGVTSPSFALPEPQPGETYNVYIQRLRDLGYIGDITTTDSSMAAVPSASPASKLVPGEITEIEVPLQPKPGTAVVAKWDIVTGNPVAWPSTPPVVRPGTTTTITIHKVPDSYDPTAHGNSTPVGSINPVTGVCNCGSVDFTPFTSLTPGTGFPFGVFNWLTTSLGTIPTTGVPLSFTVNLPYGGTQTVNTRSTTWEITYKPIVFPIIEFFMTICFFYVFATRILGLGGGE